MERAAGAGVRRVAATLLAALIVGSTGGLVLAAPAGAVAKKPATKLCAAGLVALTFDDGPSPTQTPRLVRILREKRVPATFFMVGSRVRSSPGTARLVQRSGFVVGNHSWSHPLMTRLSDRAVRDQLVGTARALRHAGVVPSKLMRPPYGGINPRVRADIENLGLLPLLWSVDSLDWRGGTARQIADRILAQLTPHGRNVVLQHDGVNNSPNSISAVPLVVTEARRRGYCFTALDDRGRKIYPVPRLTPIRTVRLPARAPLGSAADRGVTSTSRVLLSVVQHGGGFRFGALVVSGRPASLGGPPPAATTGRGFTLPGALIGSWLRWR